MIVMLHCTVCLHVIMMSVLSGGLGGTGPPLASQIIIFIYPSITLLILLRVKSILWYIFKSTGATLGSCKLFTLEFIILV